MSSKLKCVFGCGRDGLYEMKTTGGFKCSKHHNQCPAKKAKLSETVKKKWDDLSVDERIHNSRGLIGYRDGGAGHLEVIERARQARILRGSYLDPVQQTDYQIYRTNVRRLTGQNYKKYLVEINPLGLPRGKEWHLDHKLSIADGFRLGVSADVISHPENLQLIPAVANQKKNRCSSLTLHELEQRIKTVHYVNQDEQASDR